MAGTNPHVLLGIIFLIIGLGVMLTLDPWYLGVVFVLIGAHRLFVGLTMKASAKE